MEVRCTECLMLLPIKKISNHMINVHKKSYIEFACPFDSCKRVYDCKNSFNWHYLHNHDEETLECYNKNNSYNMNIEVQGSNESTSLNDVTNLVGINHNKSVDCSSTSQIITSPLSQSLDTVDYHKTKNKELATIPSFTDIALKTALTLYGDEKLNRNQAELIIDHFNKIINGDFFNTLKEQIKDHVTDKDAKSHLDEKFGEFQKSFLNINTEWKFKNELKKKDYLVDCKKIIVGYSEEFKNNRLIYKSDVECIMSLKSVLRKFLEMPRVYEEIRNYIEKLQCDKQNISNIIQTKYWKSKIQGIDNMVLPLFLYEDDFECGNPLGSHKTVHKMTGMYISIACLPSEICSKVDNIFLFQVIHSKDIKKHSSKIIYQNAIEQLNDLASEGIVINVKRNKIKVNFKLALILGDNLGVNSILGFTKSFKITSQFCRFCKNIRIGEDLKYDLTELVLRNVKNYKIDIRQKAPKKTGIREEGVMNEIKDFHVTNNPSVDVMHDIFEGIGRFELALILKYFIKKKNFTLESFNHKLISFPYNDRSNIPPPILSSELKKLCIKKSAAEMKCLILNLGLIIGDLITPRNDDYWKLYILLRKITSLVLQRVITKNDVDLLTILIRKHHALLKKLGIAMKPKHHIILHYPAIMKTIGPLVNIWSMRFESKNQILKQYAVRSYNKKNLSYTVGLNEQLRLSKLFMENKIFEQSVSYKIQNNNDDEYKPIIYELIDVNRYLEIEYLQINNIKYKKNSVVKITNGSQPTYGEINYIFGEQINHEEKFLFIFIVKIWKWVRNKEYLQSYEVKDTDKYEVIEYESLHYLQLRNKVTGRDGKYYISYDKDMF